MDRIRGSRRLYFQRAVAGAPASRLRTVRVNLLAAVLTAAALGVAAAPAQATFFAETADPAGDMLAGEPAGRDLIAAGIGYDRVSGSLVAGIQLAGDPAGAPALATLFVGSRGDGTCNGYPAVGVSADTNSGDARWHRLNGTSADDNKMGRATTHGYGAAVQMFTVESRADLEKVKPDCAIITLSAVGNAQVIYDAIGPLPLKKEAQLMTELRKVPKGFVTNRSREVQIRITNPGDARSKPIKLRFKKDRGLTVKPSRVSVRSLKAGARKTVKVRVTATSRAKRWSTLTAITTAGDLEARAEQKLLRVPKSKPSTGSGGGGSQGLRLCNRWIPDFSGQTGGSLTLTYC